PGRAYNCAGREKSPRERGARSRPPGDRRLLCGTAVAPRGSRDPRSRRNERTLEAEMTPTRRALISSMQVTLDGYVLGPEGDVDSFGSWADGLELLPPVDAFVLGGGMFPGYEQFWGAVLHDPSAVAEMLGRDPYPREVSYARVAADTPHMVLSTTLTDA